MIAGSVWLLLSSLPAHAGDGAVPGPLARHVALEQWVAELPVAEQAPCCEELHLAPEHLDRAVVALYTNGPLGPTDATELAARGIALVPGVYIPPVPGRHPLGFHLADVPHGELAWLAADPRCLDLASAESAARGANDTSTAMLKIDQIQDGECVFPRSGLGVSIGFADTGFDTSLLDIGPAAEAYDITTGTSPLDWSPDVFGPQPGHGTHVLGVAASSGFYSAGRYGGAAFDANLHLYKTLDDSSGFHHVDSVILALMRAVELDLRIFNLSIGLSSPFLDGSSPLCQAVDHARTEGVLVFAAAGNEQSTFGHARFTLGPGESTPMLRYGIQNLFAEDYDTPQSLQVIWHDSDPTTDNALLEVTNLEADEEFVENYYATSPRDTEAKNYSLSTSLEPGAIRVFDLTLTNTATDGDPVEFHIYRTVGFGAFNPPDSTSTLLEPGLADLAVTIGAWTSKTGWVDVEGNPQVASGAVFDSLANFSGLGPRVDGLRKPDLVAPGVAIVSNTATGIPVVTSFQVDDDELFGEGTSNYSVRNGTSFATPAVVGAAALILEAAPHLTADEVDLILRSTASQATAPDDVSGFGLVDAQAALQMATGAGCFALYPSAPAVEVALGGDVRLQLDAGEDEAGQFYFLLGSTSGTDPGLLLENGDTLPLTQDAYFLYSLLCVPGAPLVNGCGFLDAEGRAEAIFQWPEGLGPQMSGIVLHHAYCVVDVFDVNAPVRMVSNAVGTELL